VLDSGPDPPMGMGNFEREVVAHCKVKGHYAVSCAKTAEAIKMPFCISARVGKRNNVLDVSPDYPKQMGNF